MGLFGSGPKEAGEIDHYTVMYQGGLPQYPKSNSSPLLLKICNDRLVFHPTFGASWFKAFAVKLSDITAIELARRQAGLLESALGGLDSTQLNTTSLVEVSFMNGASEELKTRWQMISGLSAQGAAAKAAEMMDLLRSRGLLAQTRQTTAATVSSPSSTDVPSQILRLAELRDKGILSDAEFAEKKAELLQRM